MSKIKTQEPELFALHLDGKPLHLIKERWNQSRPSKRIYFSESAAKIGLNHIDRSVRDRVEIVRYVPAK